MHTVIDDYSRVAYAEIHDDEKAVTAVGVLYRAVAWFAERGVTVERVLSDNGSAYMSHLWRDSCADLGITHQEDPAPPTPDQRQDRTTSTAPWPTAGPTRSSTPPRTPAAPPWQDGSTSTTTTGPTQPWAANHPSAGWTTWPDITASRPRRQIVRSMPTDVGPVSTKPC